MEELQDFTPRQKAIIKKMEKVLKEVDKAAIRLKLEQAAEDRLTMLRQQVEAEEMAARQIMIQQADHLRYKCREDGCGMDGCGMDGFGHYGGLCRDHFYERKHDTKPGVLRDLRTGMGKLNLVTKLAFIFYALTWWTGILGLGEELKFFFFLAGATLSIGIAANLKELGLTPWRRAAKNPRLPKRITAPSEPSTPFQPMEQP